MYVSREKDVAFRNSMSTKFSKHKRNKNPHAYKMELARKKSWGSKYN